jgi:prefoldin subunit 5
LAEAAKALEAINKRREELEGQMKALQQEVEALKKKSGAQ